MPVCRDRGDVVRVAEVGAADGRCGRRDGTHPAQARRALSGADAEPEGLRRRACGRRDEVAVFVAASESFSQKNINCTIAESLERVEPGVRGGRRRRACACAATFPACWDARTKATSIRAASPMSRGRCIDMGAYEVSLGDTIGTGTAGRPQALLRLCAERVPVAALAGHFHDTYGQALTNVYSALEHGCRDFRLLGRRPRRLSLREGRHRQRRQRRRPLPAGKASASRPAST